MGDALYARVESPALSTGAVALHALEGRESIGKLFDFSLDIVCDQGVRVDQRLLLGSEAEIGFLENGAEVRRIFGVVYAIEESLEPGSWERYRLSVGPRMHALTLVEASEVMLDLSVPEAIAEKLSRYGFQPAVDFELRLGASYPKREIIVQYKETDLAFVSRLAEHLGISFFFEHESGRDVIVFTDDNSGFRPLAACPIVAYTPLGRSTGVHAIASRRQALPSRYDVKDYNYRAPRVALAASSAVSDAGSGAIVEYGGHFKTPDEAAALARVRAQEIAARQHTRIGSSVKAALAAGGRFKIDGNARVEEELLITEVRHTLEQTVYGFVAKTDLPYRNEFEAIDASTTFRPPRNTPRPRVHGSITGIVESARTGDYAELDDHGRYHVRFLFDGADSPRGKASHLIRMTQPHAGPGYGFHFPLRDGVEVVLTCIEGDPDRPIISGAVPNPATPTTVSAKNGMRNVIRTGGGTEINLDDKEGSTRFKVTVPHANTVFQLGAPNAPVSGILMGTEKDAEIDAGETLTIDVGEQIDITAGINLNASAPWIHVSAGEKILEDAPIVEVIGGSEISQNAPSIKLNGSSNITGTAPGIDLQAGSTLHAMAPDVVLRGGTKISAGAPIVEVSGEAIIKTSSGAVTVIHAGAAVNIDAGGAVTVSAPVVTVSGSGTVNVSGGTVNISGGGTTNIKGGVVNLNS